MKIRPAFSAFILRYFIFFYFLVWALFSIWIKDQVNYTWYILAWIFMTMLPAFILSFKRSSIGWFIWIGLLDVIAFAPKFKPVYDFLLSLSTDHVYQDAVKLLQNSPEVKIYVFVALIGIFFTQIYRLSFSYVITKKGVTLKSGILSRKERIVSSKHITDVVVYRSLAQRLVGIGTIVLITASSMGTGEQQVFAGGEVRKGALGGFMGAAHGQQVAIVNDPSNAIYGVKNPNRVVQMINDLLG